MTAKPNIIVVHGALGSAAQMEPVARALGSLGNVVNVELRGHGNRKADASEFNLLAFAEQLREVAQKPAEANSAAPLVFGYSMGGYAALTLESQHPGTFAGIVTLGTKFAWNTALAERECMRLDARVISEKIPKFAKALEERHAHAGGWELVLERTAALLTELGSHPLLTKETLGRVQAKVCLAIGERDDTVNISEALEYASYIQNAVSELIPDAPHPIERVPTESIVMLVRKHFLQP